MFWIRFAIKQGYPTDSGGTNNPERMQEEILKQVRLNEGHLAPEQQVQRARLRQTMRDTMAAMETRLAKEGFMRINRSPIVNLSRIRELEPVSAGEFSVLLKSGIRFHMTCSLGDLQTRMGKL